MKFTDHLNKRQTLQTGSNTSNLLTSHFRLAMIYFFDDENPEILNKRAKFLLTYLLTYVALQPKYLVKAC
jgi:hypothetical protein